MRKPGIDIIVTGLIMVFMIFCTTTYGDQDQPLIAGAIKADWKQVQELIEKGV